MLIDTSKDIDSDGLSTLQGLPLIFAVAVVTGLGIITMVDPNWLPW